MKCRATPDVNALVNGQTDMERHRGQQCVRIAESHEMHWTGPGGLWFSDQWALPTEEDDDPTHTNRS